MELEDKHSFDKPRVSDAAWVLHKKAIVVDIHTHPLLNVRHLGKNPGKRHRAPWGWNPLMNHIDFPRALDAGVTCLGSVAYPLHNLVRENDYFRSLKLDLDCFQRVVQEHGETVCQVKTAQDIREAKAQGKLGLFAAVEGAHSLDANLDHVEYLAEQGVCYLTLAHFLNNHFAQACSDPNPPFSGLSRLGKDLVAELNRQNILVDVAHLSEAGFWEVMKLSKAPVISSHTGLRKFCDISRNLSTQQMQAIVDSGGVIGICFWPRYLRKHGIKGRVDWIVESILHCLEAVGPQSVCLGSDMDGYIWLPGEMRDITDLPILTQYLMDVGLSEPEIMGILGENFLQLMERTFGTQKKILSEKKQKVQR